MCVLCAGCCVGCALAGVIGERHARTWRTKVSIKPLLVQMHKVRQSVLVVLVAKAPRPAYTHCAINVAGLLLAASSRHWSIVNPIEEFSCLKISFAVIEFLQSSAFECRCVASICSIFSQGKEISGPLSLVGGVVCGYVSCVNNASLYSCVWVVFLIMLPLKCAQNMRVCVCVPLCIVCGHVAVYGCAAHLYTLLIDFARVRYPCSMPPMFHVRGARGIPQWRGGWQEGWKAHIAAQ